jgi:hypothetical protein
MIEIEQNELVSCRNGWRAVETETHHQPTQKKIDGLQVCAILFFHLHYSTISP